MGNHESVGALETERGIKNGDERKKKVGGKLKVGGGARNRLVY